MFIRRRAAVSTHPETNSASAETDGLPSHWDPIRDGEDYRCVPLKTIADEYKKTEKKFLETMDGSHNIIKIERVQNPDLWIPYTQ